MTPNEVPTLLRHIAEDLRIVVAGLEPLSDVLRAAVAIEGPDGELAMAECSTPTALDRMAFHLELAAQALDEKLMRPHQT